MPPGWDRFAVLGEEDETGQPVVLSSGRAEATEREIAPEEVGTWIFTQAETFLDAHADVPLFLMVAPLAPHTAGTPAEQDADLYTDAIYTSESQNEADRSDKASWIQDEALTDDEQTTVDWIYQAQLRNLVGLDRETAALYAHVQELPGTTLFIYASDNGYLYGEHELWGKALPYEESVHVPLYVAGPGVEAGSDERLVAANLDLPATITAWFGAEPVGEGLSTLPAFTDATAPLREEVFLEDVSLQPWAGLVTERWKYIEWATGERELYDLDADPLEMESQIAAPPEEVDLYAWGDQIASQQALTHVTPFILPSVAPDESVVLRLRTVGGTEPVRFSATELPDGLTLTEDGTLSGAVGEEGVFGIDVVATDSSASARDGAPQTNTRGFILSVRAEGAISQPFVRVERLDAGRARFTVDAQGPVRVEACRDPSFEAPCRAAEGPGPLLLLGLDDGAWTYRVSVDGHWVARGRVPTGG